MSEKQYEFDYNITILLVGEVESGKTTLLIKYTEQEFQLNKLTTIGIDYKSKIVDYQGKRIKIQLWDTAGQERFKTISKNYYRGAHAIFFIYDITNMDSFNRIQQWINEIEQNLPSDIIKVLIGNKCDLNNNRQVCYGYGKEFAALQGLKFFESSALENINIQEPINYVIEHFIQQNQSEQQQKVEKNLVLSNQIVPNQQNNQIQQCQC
ncbi:unnamed protein product [Paramecium pentaurelia]|uniref:Uncharacterized protein n=1 Tax=Paramecium pentaurelia TaxID=43138 RepID=A0A8S1XV75_9CILI|nr:unnamed protein product [Paramecium pentaurelia]